MKIIIQNDDFGLNHGFNKGVVEAVKNGLTTSVSIRTNGTAYNEAVKLLKGPLKNTGLGLHLNLTDGPTHTTFFSDRNGKYKFNYIQYMFLTITGNQKILRQIEKEFDAQIKIGLKSKLIFDHLSGHDHIHMIPPIFEITCKLARKYKIRYIRLSKEPFFLGNGLKDLFLSFANMNIIRFSLLNIFASYNRTTLKHYNLISTEAFYGVLYTNHMTLNTLINALKDANSRNYKCIELLSHPAIQTKEDVIYTSNFIEKYTKLKNRQKELSGLTNKKFKKIIETLNIKLSSYKYINS